MSEQQTDGAADPAGSTRVNVIVAEQQQVYSRRRMECVWYSRNAAGLAFMSAYLEAFQPSLTHSGSVDSSDI